MASLTVFQMSYSGLKSNGVEDEARDSLSLCLVTCDGHIAENCESKLHCFDFVTDRKGYEKTGSSWNKVIF